MSYINSQVEVSVNGDSLKFEGASQTGQSIKERACIPRDHVLCLLHPHKHKEHGRDDHGQMDELEVIGDGDAVELRHGQQFMSHASACHSGVVVTINQKRYEFDDRHQTGRTIKEKAGIPLEDVLFLQRPGDDEVITDDTKIVLKHGECFHSSPPANYGNSLDGSEPEVGLPNFEKLPQPDGWTFLVVRDFPLPEVYVPNKVSLLVKLPPLFPEAAPDMFWVSPQVKIASGASPQGTSSEALLGKEWQRFSWHLRPGAWHSGLSTLRDFIRCVRARFEKRN